MNPLTVPTRGSLHGCVRVPGDKSISHRALLLGALAAGGSSLEGLLTSGDTLATLSCIQALGVAVEQHDATTLTLHGSGLQGLRSPTVPLHCARSGTTMRLLAGILAGQPFNSVLTGDIQLLRRPMLRVVEPLARMGANITTTAGRAPLTIRGQPLHGCDHTLPIASAQVASALLLAGLRAAGPTTVRLPGPARDHTQRMLSAMGATMETIGLSTTLYPGPHLTPLSMRIPGDLSSAAFLLVAAALLPGSEVTVEDVGINPTRTGLLDVLQEMGANLTIANARVWGNEPVADVTIRAAELRGVEIRGHTVVRMLDEFPVLAVAATQAHGTTTVRDAAELRVKESDRIAAIATELQALGARITARPDGFVVEGPTPLHGGVVHSHGDHRLAMALAVAGLVAHGEVLVEDNACMADSFPGFMQALETCVEPP